MKKLRLIKPWKLRAVRQRLGDVSISAGDTFCMIPCCGPVAYDEDVMPSEDNRICKYNGRAAYRNSAPVSGVSFQSLNNKNIR